MQRKEFETALPIPIGSSMSGNSIQQVRQLTNNEVKGCGMQKKKKKTVSKFRRAGYLEMQGPPSFAPLPSSTGMHTSWSTAFRKQLVVRIRIHMICVVSDHHVHLESRRAYSFLRGWRK